MFPLAECEVYSKFAPKRISSADMQVPSIISGKLVVLGDQGVGKTSTCMRYLEGSFNNCASPTIGASFFISKIKVMSELVRLQIWDTAGQERFKSMTPLYYRRSNAVFFMFDITSVSSFKIMKDWVLELKKNVENPILMCVLGNKIDLAEQREVPRNEALRYCQTIGAHYFEISAMKDQGIVSVFEFVANYLVNMSRKKSSPATLKGSNTEYVNGVLATSTELEATDIGNEESVHLSIDSIAHGLVVKPRCC